MASDVKVYVNGAFIPNFLVNGGAPSARPPWRVGNLILTGDAVEATDRQGRHAIALAAVTALSGPVGTMTPPPASFSQVILVHHKTASGTAATAIALPAVTVKNFPLQLSAALAGSVKAFIPTGSAYEEVRFSYESDKFRIVRRIGQLVVPLDKVSSLTVSKGRDSQGREFLEWVLQYVEGDSVKPLSFVGYERLPFLYGVLAGVAGMRRNVAHEQAKALDKVSEMAEQVAVLLYTGGVNGAMIEQMLSLSPDQLDAIYEELLKLGLADVVKVRKEIKLNAAGAKVVDDIMKKQLEATG